MQSLKKIHAWAQMQDPLWELCSFNLALTSKLKIAIYFKKLSNYQYLSVLSNNHTVSYGPCQIKGLLEASLTIVHSSKQLTKVLIRLYGCAGWSAPWLFTNSRRQVFSRRGPYGL